jgi:hypothetical protein
VSLPPRPLREALRRGWGGLAQRRRGAEDNWEGGMQLHRRCFLQRPWSAENGIPQNPPPQKHGSGHGPNSPRDQVENATASSAGGTPEGGWGGLAQRRRGAEDYWEGGMQIRRRCFLQRPWSAETGIPQNPPPQKHGSGHGPNPPRDQVENATAPLRLCARPSGSGWGWLGAASCCCDSFSDDHLLVSMNYWNRSGANSAR